MGFLQLQSYPEWIVHFQLAAKEEIPSSHANMVNVRIITSGVIV
jgi:hypothetical protein